MKKYILVIALATIALLSASQSLWSEDPKGANLRDPKILADKLVNQCAGVKAGDIVLITGGGDNLDLLDELWLQAKKQGAFPLVSLGSSNRTMRYYDVVPPQFDSVPDKLGMKLAELVDVIISIDYPSDPVALAAVPTDRQTAMNKANAAVQNIYGSRSVKEVSVGNGLYPSPGAAAEYGVPLEVLAADFWKGLATDYTAMGQISEKLRKVLATGKQVTITNANGTNVRMSIAQSPIFVSDGVISADEAKKGRAFSWVWLPAGEVYLPVVSGSAEGTVVVDEQNFYGSVIKDLKLTFAGGKLTNMTAANDCSRLKERFDAAGDLAKNLVIVDFGINPDLKYTPGNRLCTYVQSGMVSINTGNNNWAGGPINESGFSWTFFLPGTSVQVDGVTIIEKGDLKI